MCPPTLIIPNDGPLDSFQPLDLRGADESVDRTVETTGQLFRLWVLWVQDALEPEAID
jgi:hypothetical protein